MMRRGMQAAGAVALLATACVPQYEPPTPNQPHAVIKVRRTYDQTAGTSLREAVEIDEHSALREVLDAVVAKAPRTDGLLAHPVPGTFMVRSGFFHEEMRTLTESYEEPHTTYSTESDSCGTVTSYDHCTRTVSHTEYTTKYRTVTQQVEVSDGHCARGIRFAPQDRHVYLLQYSYQAPSVCALSCYEQVQGPDGTFNNLPCPAAPLDPAAK
jgi:hypothetical protein